MQVEFASNWTGVDQYVDKQGSRGKFPDAAEFPSVTPNIPPLYKVLGGLIENNHEVFRCPDDQLDPKDATPIEGITYETYFDQEGLSYEYRNSRLANKTREQFAKSGSGDETSSSRVWVVYDFQPFHGSEGQNGSRNFVYLDGHVDALIVAE